MLVLCPLINYICVSLDQRVVNSNSMCSVLSVPPLVSSIRWAVSTCMRMPFENLLMNLMPYQMPYQILPPSKYLVFRYSSITTQMSKSTSSWESSLWLLRSASKKKKKKKKQTFYSKLFISGFTFFFFFAQVLLGVYVFISILAPR